MNLIQQFSVNNDCYAANKNIIDSRYSTFQKRGALGLVLHSIGTPQPNPKVLADIWNNSYKAGKLKENVAVHAVVGTDLIIQCLPWNYRGWHGGVGNLGSVNDTHIGVEMTEPSTIKYTGKGAEYIDNNPAASKEHVLKTYNLSVKLFARLCSDLNLNPLKDGVIISHVEGYKKGIASNHGDPEHLFVKYGLSMNQFRRDVDNYIRFEMGDKITMGYSKTINLNDLIKAEYININGRMVDQLQAQTGADIVINGGIYGSTGLLLGVCKAGNILSGSPEYLDSPGIALNGSKVTKSTLRAAAASKSDFVTSYIPYPKTHENYTQRRGRTLVALWDTVMTIHVAKDGTNDAMTFEQADNLYKAPFVWHGDGGGSSAVKDGTTLYGGQTNGTFRGTYGAIGFWLKYPTLKQGHPKTDSVGRLQETLNKVGGYNLVVDKVFGNATKNAVITFQKQKGLTQDGICGINTWTELNKALQNVAQNPKEISVDNAIKAGIVTDRNYWLGVLNGAITSNLDVNIKSLMDNATRIILGGK